VNTCGFGDTPLGSSQPKSALPDALKTGVNRRAQASDRHSPDQGLYRIFAGVAASTPDAIAIHTETRTLTYSQLATAAGNVAAALVFRGVQPGDFVALLESRSVDAIIAMLGILRAGAAYVPLDVTHAPEQLPFIATDLPFKVALVAARYDDLAVEIFKPSITVLGLETSIAQTATFKDNAATPDDDPAYVLYTSGTTGAPKGVVIPQGAVAAYCLNQPLMAVQPSEVVLHASTIACDGSIFDIFVPLLNGASIAVVENSHPSLDDIAAVMIDQKVTAALLYAGLHHLMIDHRLNAFETLRLICAGGDVMSPSHVARLLEAWPQIKLRNLYGPTEATVATLGVDVTGDMLAADCVIPIGRPLFQRQAFVVDDNLVPLPAGQTGQLVLAGPALALGYYGREDLTAKVFIADPRPGYVGRVYLSGDLAYQRPDGNFMFKGRIDRQIKLEGRRIEIDGIEHCLRNQPGIADAVVEVIETPTGRKIAAALTPSDVMPEDSAAFLRAVMANAAQIEPESTLPRITRLLANLPLTPAGKVDRKAVRALLCDPASVTAPVTAPSLRAEIAAVWDMVLACGPISDDTTFFEAGGTSIQLIDAHARLETALNRRFDLTLMFEAPRLGDLAMLLAQSAASDAVSPVGSIGWPDHCDQAIAITGLAGRFPGAASVDDFWQHIRNGDNLIAHLPIKEMQDALTPGQRADPAYMTARSILPDVDKFDTGFFDMLPREAAQMDPQARLFLEICVEALEDAGVDPARAPGPVGVFAGATLSTYLLANLLADRTTSDEFTASFQLGNYAILTGNTNDNLAGRVAYKLDLKGPAMAISSACSTSLTAIAQAVQALRAGQSDVALAGGVSITFPQKRGYFAQDGGMASTDGVCRPFDADASGTVFGHGAGVVVLKRLHDAQAAGDRIYGVIRGAGVSNDGADKMSYTAPSVGGQAAAIRLAHRDAGIAPETVSYVECHGTATPLGDPIEIRGLARGFGDHLPERCAIGSVKGNIGHLDAAAGVMGVIKTALMLHHAEIPPVAGFRAANPKIDFQNLPFYVPTGVAPWQVDGPRRAGISAFGVGGTNVHLLLEQAPDRAARTLVDAVQILPLSAKSPEALTAMINRLADALAVANAPLLADAAYTLQEGRKVYPYRFAVAASDNPSAAKALCTAKVSLNKTPTTAAPLVFLFAGQGSQYPGMGAGLYRAEPEYARWIDRGAEILAPLVGLDIRSLLCHADAADQTATEALRDTGITQPALYLTQYATAKLWQARGVVPTSVIGHSVGEYAAAAMAGVFDFETGLSLIARRGRLMQDQPKGAMLSVRATLQDLIPYLDDTVDLAAMNAPKLQVVSGPDVAITGLADRLRAAGIAVSILKTSQAFHSRMMDAVVDPLQQAVARAVRSAPTIPIISTVTGARLTTNDAQSPGYWAGQARATVNFQAALQAACQTDIPVFLEVGAGRTLATLTAQCLERGSSGRVFHSLPDHTSSSGDENAMAAAFANLWSAGIAVDWARFGPRGTRRVSLPTYPFQRQSHWIAPPVRVLDELLPRPHMLAIQDDPIMPQTFNTPQETRLTRLTNALIAMLADLSGEDMGAADVTRSFLELGFDSLFMGQVSQALQRKYNVTLSFRQLLADMPSIAALAAHLDTVLAGDVTAPAACSQAVAPVQAQAAMVQVPMRGVSTPGDLTDLMQAQMQTMQTVFAEQLRAAGGMAAVATPPVVAPVKVIGPPADSPAETRFKVGRGAVAQNTGLTPEQQAFIQVLVQKSSAKFAKSKAYVDVNRAALADPRTAAGFRPEWKDLVFPIVSDRSKGAYLWDLDGNRFVDLVNGFGQTAFGHSPEFVSAAVAAQLDRGYAIGPQSGLAGPVATKVAAMTGHQRVTFCNTGSEAVMAAMRLARAVTGRDRIVVFSNDYHGQFDEVLVKGRARGGDPIALPIAPGIPRSGLANMTVLDYGANTSLDWIKANSDQIAAVIVEPVQSRHPLIQPVEFLRQLRAITQDTGSALVFDEVVTGFRVHPRGMQGLWDIKADMATYGKVVGGGMPVGILAGDARFMDALDGGAWSYDDDSKPEVAPTFFAGTFVRHPLVLAAVDATLDHMAQKGDELWSGAADRSRALVARMNATLAAHGLAEFVEGFSSWFVINASQTDPRAALLYPLMRLSGVHLIDGYCGFMTTAHSDADIEQIATAFQEALRALQSVGILCGQGDVPVKKPVQALIAPEVAIPLTAGQREIWAVHQLGDMAACSFNESVSIDLQGRLDVPALNGALSALVMRHDALRMVFDRKGETFRVRLPFTPDVLLTDFSGAADAQSRLNSMLAKDARKPVDITKITPMRFHLVKLAEAHHVLVMTVHHIACDGWAYGVLFDEIAQLYANRVAGHPDALPAAPSFATYALTHTDASADTGVLQYWRARFADLPDLPDLPTDALRPLRKSFNGATTTAYFDADLTKAVQKAGAGAGCTLFATMFGGLQITIGRLSGTNDVVLGVPTGGQALLKTQSLVGHCVNLLPIRQAFDAAQPVKVHLKQVARSVMDAFDHQDITYGALVRGLNIPPNLNRLPLTEIQFNLERTSEAFDMGGVTASVSPNPKAGSNFDMFFNLSQSASGIRLDVDYNADIYAKATIDRWIGHYRHILAAIADDSGQMIASLPMEVAAQADAPVQTIPDPRLIQDMVAKQVLQRPDAIAAEDAQGRLTYRALADHSDALAHLIQSTVSTVDRPIAVLLPRDRMLPAALLGVLKSGHAYVPLDPQQPAARLQDIARAAGVAAVIANTADAALANDLGVPVIDPEDAQPHTHPIPQTQTPDATAYVIFTSGSTGAPKGVEIPHSAVVNFLASMAERPGMTAQDSLLAVTTVTFDIAVLELFLPLTTGGRCVVASAEDVHDGFAIVQRLSQGDISLMQATPTLWDMLLDAGLQPNAGLKLLTGGEPLPQDLAKGLTAGGGRLWNLYGPTETTVWSALKRIHQGDDISIGDPIANTELHVLDEWDQHLPIGVIGELNIGGAGLAKGYANQPELTDAAFRMVTLNGCPRRLYRTGDLARRLASGAFQVMGRKDTQVKLRGFRIELGDIECRLRLMPGVAKAVVDLHTRPNGDKQLVAYLVAQVDRQVDTAKLAVELACQLPDYMVPQAWVMLGDLPQTANGKLNRKALPAPDHIVVVQPQRQIATPRSDTEIRLAAIWSKVLGTADISVTDTLFALGIDSLNIFRIAARQMDAGFDLDARDMMTHLTIRALAAHADDSTTKPATKRPLLKDYRNGALRNRGAA